MSKPKQELTSHNTRLPPTRALFPNRVPDHGCGRRQAQPFTALSLI